MEPQTLGTAPAVQTTSAPAPVQSGGSGVTGGDIFKTLVHSFICGFAIGLGVIVAVKMAGKKVILKDSKADATSSINGYSPMYPPRNMPQNGRPPMYPPNMMPPNMSQRPPYMMATGEQKQVFNINEWMKKSPEMPLLNDILLNEIQD